MNSYRVTNQTRIGLVLSTVLFVWNASGQEQIQSQFYDQESMSRLTSLLRVVRMFDFEDRRIAPHSLPSHFYRRVSRAGGFPPFGTVGIDNGDRNNSRSLKFELNGGPLSVVIPSELIPVLPQTDYDVAIRIKSSGLVRESIRIIACIYDQSGNLIPNGCHSHDLSHTNDRWNMISVDIPGNYEDAASMSLELQVLQHEDDDYAHEMHDDPLRLNQHGTVWFDDITVRRMPRVDFLLQQPSNIVRQSERIKLNTVVTDPRSNELTARLTVTTINGDVVFGTNCSANQLKAMSGLRVPTNDCGWYRATLDIREGSNVLCTETLDYLVIPDATDNQLPTSTTFGMHFSHLKDNHLPQILEIIESLDSNVVVLSPWSFFDSANAKESFRKLVHSLLQKDVEVIFSLDTVPPFP